MPPSLHCLLWEFHERGIAIRSSKKEWMRLGNSCFCTERSIHEFVKEEEWLA